MSVFAGLSSKPNCFVSLLVITANLFIATVNKSLETKKKLFRD